MNTSSHKKSLLAIAISIAAVTSMPLSYAEEIKKADEAQENKIEKIIVTGSRIKRTRQDDSPTPVSVIGAEDFALNGAKDARDVIALLPINAGSENNSDLLTQNFTVGTANVNLRGLGVSSTLVLLNGRRQVLSATPTNDGSSFVDIAALLPALAVERVEILKDGASAIYGSDAVAGVFNMITRDTYEGAEFQVEYREKAGDGDQRDINFDAVIGNYFGDYGHFLFAASYLDRSLLTGSELNILDPNDNSSGFGNPATYRLADGTVEPDPQCEEFGGFFNPGSNFCRRDFGPHLTFVPNEKRLQVFSKVLWDWNDKVNLWAEVGYARNDSHRAVSTTSPVLFPTVVPTNNPGNIFGQEATFLGRPYWPGFEDKPEDNYFLHTTTRTAIGGNGELSDTLSWDVSYVSAKNDVQINLRDVVVNRFQAALNGFGGFNCIPGVGTAGVDECKFFNPLASNFNAPSDSPLSNDPELRNFLVAESLGLGESKINVLEANLTGELIEVPAGTIYFALGAQYREEKLSYVYDGLSNASAFGFIIGNQNFSGSLDVNAIYGEVVIPLSDTIELNAALRYEDYGSDIGDTTDPKVSILWTPSDSLAFRGSYSTSFRAPTVFQTQGVQTTFQNILDANGNRTFAGIRTNGSQNLKPEISTAYNVGTSFSPIKNLHFNIDYWNFSFEDALSRINAQGIVDTDPNDSRIARSSAGTIVLVNTAFFNANSIDTSGLDLSVTYSIDTNIGTFTPKLDGTYVATYDLTDVNGQKTDGVGSRNATNFGNSTPEFRGNIGVSWAIENHSANLVARHIDSYHDDLTDKPVSSFTSIDAQYNFQLDDILRADSDTTLTFGVVNLTDKQPPSIAIAGNYDSKTHDPRGRRVYVKLSASF